MELEYGTGEISAVINLTPFYNGHVRVYPYMPDTVEEFHRIYGGRHYYDSRSGASGAGWIPDRFKVRKVPTMRVDVARPRVPRGGDVVPGVRVVGFNSHIREFHNVVAVIKSEYDHDGTPLTTIWWESPGCISLGGPPSWLKSQDGELVSWVPAYPGGSRLDSIRVKVTEFGHPGKLGSLSHRRILELLLWEELYKPGAIPQSMTGIETPYQVWLRRLGLVEAVDRQVYAVAGGLLRRPVDADDRPGTWPNERMSGEDYSPPWAHNVKGTDMYVTQSGEDFVLTGKTGERYLTVSEALSLLGDNPPEIGLSDPESESNPESESDLRD